MVSRIPKAFQFEFRKWWKPSVASGDSQSSEAKGSGLGGLFGLSGVSQRLYGESMTGIANIDQLGLTAFGGGSFAHDLNYDVPIGTSAYLPPGESWTYLGNQQGPWGNLLGFRAPNGGVVEFNHLGSINNFVIGQSYQGGTFVGKTGGPYDSRYWTGPHLGVITDSSAYSYLQALSQKQGFIL
ncbi:MAG: hypothetical protein C5B59_13700 [Bacteroidetes bacterium]|nr:MAG: hypothetical protein C5B59_13700 [Bacteroidota bacterium]